MIRKEAINIIVNQLAKFPFVSANGYISRDLFESLDKESNFYMIGSMGLASSIALGLAIKKNHTPIIVLDGDGNILMNLGSLITIGSIKPRNLIHFIFDNGVHESTGGQPTNLRKINLAKMAKAANYNVFQVNSKKRLLDLVKKIIKIRGPVMVIVKVEQSKTVTKRISHNPKEIRDRFMKSINTI